jgi:hypothetical protein
MTATKTKTLTADFSFERETKRTRKFEEVPAPGDPEVIGTLYVQKHALEGLGNPETLTVTLSA